MSRAVDALLARLLWLTAGRLGLTCSPRCPIHNPQGRKTKGCQLIIATANLHKDRPGDAAYLAHLATVIVRGVLCLQERGRGLRSTRVRGVRLRVRRKHWRTLGRAGVHRGIAVGEVTIDGRPVVVLSVHGLHVRTVGRRTQGDYYAALAARTARLDRRGRRWTTGGDFNRPHSDVAALLGGTSVGHGVDGVIVGPGLRIASHDLDWTGVREGWTDHPAVIADVRADLKESR